MSGDDFVAAWQDEDFAAKMLKRRPRTEQMQALLAFFKVMSAMDELERLGVTSVSLSRRSGHIGTLPTETRMQQTLQQENTAWFPSCGTPCKDETRHVQLGWRTLSAMCSSTFSEAEQ